MTWSVVGAVAAAPNAPKYDAVVGVDAYDGCIAGNDASAAENPACNCCEPICFRHRARRLLNHTWTMKRREKRKVRKEGLKEERKIS